MNHWARAERVANNQTLNAFIAWWSQPLALTEKSTDGAVVIVLREVDQSVEEGGNG